MEIMDKLIHDTRIDHRNKPANLGNFWGSINNPLCPILIYNDVISVAH